MFMTIKNTTILLNIWGPLYGCIIYELKTFLSWGDFIECVLKCNNIIRKCPLLHKQDSTHVYTLYTYIYVCISTT